jgi:hypothetical protein
MICFTYLEVEGELNKIPSVEEASLLRKLVKNLPKQGDEPGQRKACFAQFHHSINDFIERNKGICKIYHAHEIAAWFENKDSLSDAEKELYNIIAQHISVPTESSSEDHLLKQ